MLGNWPLLAIRIAEMLVLTVIVLVSAFAVVVPFLVSLGMNMESMPSDPSDVLGIFWDVILRQWVVLLYGLVVASIALLIVIAIHSFVSAGNARVYVDGERRVAAVPAPRRAAFACFSGDRWLGGGREGWWPVFWIYNIAWSVSGLIILVPMMLAIAVMILLRGTPALVVGIGCLGLAAFLILAIVVGVVTNIWVEKAIADCLARDIGAMESLRNSWDEFRRDLGRHLAVAVVMMVISIASSMVFSSFNWVGSFVHNANANLMLLPLQFSGSILSSVFSAAVGCWLLACFSTLAVESRPR
jgi:hypothetical protein